MNYGFLIFLGAFLTFAASWYGMIMSPRLQLKDLQQVTVPPENNRYPTVRPGLAQQGAKVYREQGCHYCHTQQVRPEGFGSDFERGWGKRFSVAQDYLYDSPALVGTLRVGPDLANIGSRQPDPNWHLLHLFNPQITSKGSTMPPYRFLFARVKSGASSISRALKLPSDQGADPGFEMVPTAEAEALVAYLLSLRSETPLLEAPLPKAKASEKTVPSTTPADTATQSEQVR